MKSTISALLVDRAQITSLLEKILRRLDSVPYALLALPLRAAAATVFWRSAMAKLASWETTLVLFEDEYQVPLLPPNLPRTWR